jgi:hypothetical protein
MSQFERNMKYLHSNKIIYRRNPINDKPSEEFYWGSFYEDGTNECYELFRSKAKITTYKSLKWHLLVLWYLNPQLTQDKFNEIAHVVANKINGFVAFDIKDTTLDKIIYAVSMSDLDYPPKNKSRKIIFKDGCGLNITEKLKIVGSLMGKSKKVSEEDLYDAMLYMHDLNKKITVIGISKFLNVSTRTIYRVMSNELKKEKELLNSQLKNEKI